MLLIREAGLEHRLLEYAEIALLAEVGHMLVHVVQISRGPEIAVPLIVGQIDFGEDLSMTPAMLALLKEQVMRAAQELERHAESFPDAVQYVYIYVYMYRDMCTCADACMCMCVYVSLTVWPSVRVSAAHSYVEVRHECDCVSVKSSIGNHQRCCARCTIS